MERPALALALPVPSIAVAPASEDLSWTKWSEKGRAHDQMMRERWLQLLTACVIVVLMTAAAVLGLR